MLSGAPDHPVAALSACSAGNKAKAVPIYDAPSKTLVGLVLAGTCWKELNFDELPGCSSLQRPLQIKTGETCGAAARGWKREAGIGAMRLGGAIRILNRELTRMDINESRAASGRNQRNDHHEGHEGHEEKLRRALTAENAKSA